MKGSELLRKLKKHGREVGLDVRYVKERGKGSHGTLYFGKRFAVVPDLKQELKTGTLRAILARLGLTPEDLK
ncbi:MAG: type II toxin-antitoxin system HicA family toxin [Thermodesulfobacteriota bacterium]